MRAREKRGKDREEGAREICADTPKPTVAKTALHYDTTRASYC